MIRKLLLVLMFLTGVSFSQSHPQLLPGTNISAGASIINFGAAVSCGPPNYCSRIDTPVLSGVTVNGGNPPATLIGLNGANNWAFDDLNVGNVNAKAYIVRVTDYPMVLADLPATQHYFTTFSSSTQRAWNSNTTRFTATDSGGGLDFFSYANGSPPTTAFLGRLLSTGGGIQVGGSGIEWDTINPLVFRGGGSPSGAGVRNNLYSFLQDGTTGAGSFTSAHVSATLLADLINAPGLTSYYSGTLGPFWNPYTASNVADIATAVGANPVTCGGWRNTQDEGSLIACYDPTQAPPGIRWIDTRTGLVGGSYGPTGTLTGWGPIPAPASTTVTPVATSGTLPCNHSYAVLTTYTVVGNNNSYGGETDASPIVISTLALGAGSTCQLAITPPVANPGGGTGINLTDTATGFNTYVCDRTMNGSCVPNLQTNNTNSSGVLAQPVISSVTLGGSSCTTGVNSHTLYLVARNANGTSVASSGTTIFTNSATQISGCQVAFTAVPNASNYDILLDSLITRTATGTVSPITTTNTFHTYVIQTTPIATTPNVGNLVTSSIAPTVNAAGAPIHNLRIDSSGQWLSATIADSFNITQVGPVKAPFQIHWHISTANLIPAGTGVRTPPYASYAAAHWTTHAGILYELKGSPTFAELVSINFNDNVSTMNASVAFLNAANGGLDTLSNGGHLSGSYENGPVFQDAYTASGAPYSLPSVPYNGEIVGYKLDGSAAYRFCHNWDSAQEGFNSTPRGSISQQGTAFLYVSDYLRNGNGLQGTSAVGVGSTSGATSCTLGTSGDCRYDLYVCQIR